MKQRVKDKPCISDEQLKEAEIDMERSYSSMLRNTRAFLDFYKVTSTYHEIEGTLVAKTGNLSAWFLDICEKKLGIYCTFHMHSDQDGRRTIFPVVYHEGSAMEWVFVVFYVEPCDKLPHDVAEVYKAFLAWTSDTLGVGPGSELNMDNFYLDSIMMWFDEEQAEGEEWRGEVAKKYRTGGEYYKKFDEIGRMKIETDTLLETLEEYRKKYFMDDDIRSLMECLIDGVPILSRMRLTWWCFCPFNDGFSDDDDYYSDDVCIPLSTSILYSPSDGVTQQIEESLNCEYSSGANMNGWNRALYVNGENGVEDFEDFEKDRNSCVEFAQWTGSYMSRISKWITEFEYE